MIYLQTARLKEQDTKALLRSSLYTFDTEVLFVRNRPGSYFTGNVWLYVVLIVKLGVKCHNLAKLDHRRLSAGPICPKQIAMIFLMNCQ